MPHGAYDEARCKAACEHIARAIVRPLVLRYYRGEAFTVSEKHDRSIATAVDSAIEREIRAFLETTFPSFGIIGEELGALRSDSEHVWTIDPIDGTEAFVAGVPLFGTLLAVIRQANNGARTPVLGALYLPVQDRLVIGNRSETRIDGCIVRMRAPAASEQRRLIVGDLSEIARKTPLDVQGRLLRIARRFRSTQTWGDCLGYLNMLEGKAHARIEAGLGVDDVAPLEPIILGAGGAVSGADSLSLSRALSNLPDLGDPSASFVSVSAVSDELHRELMDALSGDNSESDVAEPRTGPQVLG